MNATPAVSQTPIATDPAQMNPAAPSYSVKSDNNTHNFAGTMTEANSTQSRRSGAHKSVQSGSTGGQLPAAGNRVPPAAATPLVAGAPPAPVTNTAGDATPPAGPAATLSAAASAAAATASAATDHSAILGAVSGSQDQSGSGSAFAQAMALPANAIATGEPAPPAGAPAATDAVATPALSNAPTVTGKTSGPDSAKSITTLAGAASAKLATGVTARAHDSAGSDSVFAGGTPASDTSRTDSGTISMAPVSVAAAQTAAMAMAASSAATDNPNAAADSTVADASAVPVAGGKITAAGGTNLASGPAFAAAATSREAAAAAAIVLAVSTLENSGATDRHSRGVSGETTLPGTSGDSAAGLAQVTSRASTASDASATPTVKVIPAVDTAEFGQGLADRVSWMVDNNLNGAKLQINPAQLGPIEVRIAVQGGHAQVWMTSHSAVTRDALESSSAQLREMLGSQGFGQVSVDISQRSFQDRSPQAPSYDWTPSGDRGTHAAEIGSVAASNPRPASGAVDAYA